MKKIVIYMSLFLIVSVNLFAEIVYLKDGCIIKGIVIEQNNKSLTLKSDSGQLTIVKEKIQNIEFSDNILEKKSELLDKPEKSDKDFYNDFFQGNNNTAVMANNVKPKSKDIRGGLTVFGGNVSLSLASTSPLNSYMELYIESGNKKGNVFGFDLDFGIGGNSTIGSRIEYIKLKTESLPYLHSSYSWNGYYLGSGQVDVSLIPILLGYKYRTSPQGFALTFGGYGGAVIMNMEGITQEKLTGSGSMLDLCIGMDVPLSQSVYWHTGLSYIYASISTGADASVMDVRGYTLTTGLDFKF